MARNGPEFETRIRQNELNNPKFNFLNPNDPYHAYYQYKVKDFKEGKGQSVQMLLVQVSRLAYGKAIVVHNIVTLFAVHIFTARNEVGAR